ncbi:ATP-binding protein [Paraburkholderia silvatlantica]|uniref:histidine kinase n=1 Tax=Paraburkholderia silvatlantica TaxID=321895 RepID=A0ABR6FRB2_9BURK|nr:ATP-binding protein [Paraburkholderia silvatlantica]MBB2929657.1 signal transduction histidine kinase [Paraburkholderia silvatlantica]PVY35044.1 signal transduction histidine kinase [Paraburkholderia silvatlantica]PXW39454.1 signal transduction histidine kinase [Paraburkholderia silvatlantica]
MFKRIIDFPLVVTLVLLCALLTLTHLIVLQLDERAASATRDRFSRFTTDASNKIETQLLRYIDILPGMRGLWDVTGFATKEEFHAYVESLNLKQRFPSLVTLNFCDYIQTSKTKQYEEYVRKEDSRPYFKVFPTKTSNDHRLVVRFIEPVNKIYLGRDIATNFSFDVIKTTIQKPEPYTSGEAIPQLDGHKGAGLGIRLAFYRGKDVVAAADRESRFIGSSGLFVDVPSLVHEAVPGQDWKFLSLTLRTLPNAGEAADPARRQLFSFAAPSAADESTIREERSFTVAGRQFVLDFAAPKSYFNDPIGSNIRVIGYLAGSVISFAACTILYLLLASRKRLASEVSRKTKSLASTQGQVSKLLEERLQAEQEITRQGEQERQRIGRELHDDLGQKLTGASLLLGSLSQMKAREGDPEHEVVIERVSAILDEGINAIRTLSRGLTPFDGSVRDLDAALRELCSEVGKLLPNGCHLSNAYDTELLTPEASLHLYRIVQESVSNALRHGQATRIDVSVEDQKGAVLLRVRDNGVGFSPDIDINAYKSTGLGLRSIRSRAQLLGMKLRIFRNGDGGTTLEIN